MLALIHTLLPSRLEARLSRQPATSGSKAERAAEGGWSQE